MDSCYSDFFLPSLVGRDSDVSRSFAPIEAHSATKLITLDHWFFASSLRIALLEKTDSALKNVYKTDTAMRNVA